MMLSLGEIGAKRQSWHAQNPKEVLLRILTLNPTASESAVMEMCWKDFTDESTLGAADENYLRSIFEYWFYNTYKQLHDKRQKPVGRRRLSAEQLDRKTDITATEPYRNSVEGVRGLIQNRIRKEADRSIQIVLSEMVLPSGKTLANSTKEELESLGGWTFRVAALLWSNQTVAEAGITEATLRDLYEPANG